MVIQDDGERLPIVLERLSGMPHMQINDYILYVLRNNNASSTLKKMALYLAYLFEWDEERGIGLMDRLYNSEGFPRDMISVDLFEFLRKDFRKCNKKYRVVNRNTANERLLVCKKFIVYHLERFITRMRTGNPKFEHASEKSRILQKAFDELITAGNYSEPVVALTEYQLGRLLEIVKPGSRENPWQRRCQSRNYIIVLILSFLGIRRGELLNLKVYECEVGSALPSIRIERNPDNIDDIRTDEPNVKTESRILPIENDLARDIDEYILEERANITNSQDTPFLILNQVNGSPLSLRQINHIFSTIKKRFPIEFSSLSPHVLRHTSLTQKQALMEKKGMDEAAIKVHLQYLAGWRRDNSSTYTLLQIQKNCRIISEKHQKRIFTKLDDVPF